jgi:hypothetical protein
MSGDPIATPTLARLYLAQGHQLKARSILERVLTRTPLDGDALALARRLGDPAGRMTTRLDGDDLVVGWQGIRVDADTHVIAVTTRAGPTGVRTGVTSVRCSQAFGRVRFGRPPGRGALAACVARLDDGHLRIVAVATPLSWP